MMRAPTGITTALALFVLAILIASVFRQVALIPVVFVLLMIGRWLLMRRSRRATSNAPYDQYQVSGDEWDQRSSRKRAGPADWQ